MFEILKAVLFGIIEGITEWLPVSSTGHMILLDELIHLRVGEGDFAAEFYNMFEVVIQLGAILAVILLFFRKLNPFALSKSPDEKKATWGLWLRVIVAILPSGIIGVLFDEKYEFEDILLLGIAETPESAFAIQQKEIMRLYEDFGAEDDKSAIEYSESRSNYDEPICVIKYAEGYEHIYCMFEEDKE